MATKLINNLVEKCREDQSLQPLYSQWIFDQKLVSKALGNINVFYPHYSLHDETHSVQILINIERILGEDVIKKLSASDIWILLEAAYWHDIGMVLPYQALQKELKTEEFQLYLDEIKNNSSHELHNFVKNTLFNLDIDIKDVALEVFEHLRFLISGYFRVNHGMNSEEIVNAPWETIGLQSPRNSIIPIRLFKIIGRICASHNWDFDKVLNLPQVEVGFGTENIHPRYISCLLRLGDLLDLDNNRFDLVQLHSLSKIPLTTEAHLEKHLSIEHFRLDSKIIEIEASCKTYEGFTETINWFQYIEDEIQKQTLHWNHIVPKQE